MIHEFLRETVRFRTKKDSIFLAGNNGPVGIAERRRRLDKGLQHRPQIEGRATDDLEHVGGGGLLLQRFTQFAEQARILDGDHGLVSEGLDQLNLLIRKRLYFKSAEHDCANGFALSQQRSGQYRSVAKAKRHLATVRKFINGCFKVVYVDWYAINDGAPSDPPATDGPFIDLA
jgi:hypothetical protein